jgi:hypothetical protein
VQYIDPEVPLLSDIKYVSIFPDVVFANLALVPLCEAALAAGSGALNVLISFPLC